MRNKRFLIFLSLTLFFAFLSAVYIAGEIRSYTPVVRHDNPVKVVTASGGIEPYTIIQNVSVKEVPESVAPAGAFSDPGKVIGKVPRAYLLDGDIIRQDHLADTTDHTDNELVAKLSGMNDPTLRGTPISLPSGFSALTEGNKINIVHTTSSREGTITETIMQDVRVLGVEEDSGVAFLALTQLESEELAYAMSNGKIMITYSPVVSN